MPCEPSHDCCRVPFLPTRLPATQPSPLFRQADDEPSPALTPITTTRRAPPNSVLVYNNQEEKKDVETTEFLEITSSSPESHSSSPTPPQQPSEVLTPSEDNNRAAAAATVSSDEQVPRINNSDLIIMERQQGVLWKRRDVFKNRWRPRWFVVHPSQGVLTYYLLTTPESSSSGAGAIADPLATPLPHRSSSRQRRLSNSNNSSSLNNNNQYGDTFYPALAEATTEPPLRARAASWDSAVSEQSVDYDVVPRGTIDLLGCTVTPNDSLSKPAQNFYAFTIASPAAVDVDVHLACRSLQAREMWIQRLTRVCNPGEYWGSSSSNRNNGGVPQTMPARSRTAAARVPPVVMEEHPISVTTTTTAATTNMVSPLAHDTPQVATGVTSSSGSGWNILGSASSPDAGVLDNVPQPLAQRIQQEMETYLQLCEQDPDQPEHGWKKLYSRTVQNQPHRAYQRRSSQEVGRTLTRSVAILNHSPQQVFNLLVDTSRRHAFETNVRHTERLKMLNAHTFLDYYAYNAVWPTSAREFAVCLHHRVVSNQNTGERAIACLSFSCPDAEALKAPEPNHVRATLHVSMYLLRAAMNSNNSNEFGCCHLTRFLSFDLAGGVSQKLSNVILTQQASLPAVITEFLQRHEPVPENRLTGPLTNAAVVENIIQCLGSSKAGLRRRLTFTEAESFVDKNSNGGDSPRSITGGDTSQHHQDPGLETQTVLLLGPVVVYSILKYLNVLPVALTLVVFCVMAFGAVRQVVLLHIGEILPKHEDPPLLGPVTCRFSVDLKGILRFIANKKEERDELRPDQEEVTVVHLVTCAVAKAFAAEKELRLRRSHHPMLWIDELVDVSATPVDVSVSENAGGVVTLSAVDRRTVQSVADELTRAEHNHDRTQTLGDCLILATPDCDESVMETDALAAQPFSVVAVVGGTRMQDNPRGGSSRSSSSTRRPMLWVSLTISIPHLTDVVSCRRYAEEVQKLLQFPEMCDG